MISFRMGVGQKSSMENRLVGLSRNSVEVGSGRMVSYKITGEVTVWQVSWQGYMW